MGRSSFGRIPAVVLELNSSNSKDMVEHMANRLRMAEQRTARRGVGQRSRNMHCIALRVSRVATLKLSCPSSEADTLTLAAHARSQLNLLGPPRARQHPRMRLLRRKRLRPLLQRRRLLVRRRSCGPPNGMQCCQLGAGYCSRVIDYCAAAWRTTGREWSRRSSSRPGANTHSTPLRQRWLR